MGQTTQGLQNDGQTAHYQISYESSLSAADGLTRAQQLFHQCEFDFNLMSSWFPGVNFEFSFPISVQINNASGGASWNDPPNIALPFGYNPTVQINPGSGTDVNFVRYLLVSEVTEMFMASKNNGWFEDASLFSGANEGSKGEGLSRFLGFQFKAANGLQNVRYTGFEVVNFWLNSSRPNNVDVNPDDINPISSPVAPRAFFTISTTSSDSALSISSMPVLTIWAASIATSPVRATAGNRSSTWSTCITRRGPLTIRRATTYSPCRTLPTLGVARSSPGPRKASASSLSTRRRPRKWPCLSAATIPRS
jgi:hypothetical protein